MANLNTIKNWFKTGLKPTQQQFWDTFESFWHKEDTIPVAKIDGIDNLLNQKANKSVVDNHLIDASAHNDLFNAKEDKSKKGQADGYAPLNEFGKIVGEYLEIVDDLVTGGRNAILSAEQGAILSSQISAIHTLLTSDNVQLDNVQELVDAIESLQVSLNAILVNDLTTGGITKALSAEQGKQLKNLIDTLNSSIVDLNSVQTISGAKTFSKINLFTNSTEDSDIGLNLINFNRGSGMYIGNAGSFNKNGLHVFNGGGGTGFYLENLNSKGARFVNKGNNVLLTLESTTTNGTPSTGKVLSVLKLNSSGVTNEVAQISHDGKITAENFIKAGATASEFLKGDGSTSTIVNATGNATFVNQIVSKADGTLGFEAKSADSTTVYTEANCTVNTSLVSNFKFLALKKGRELIINMEIDIKLTAPTDNVYRDLVTLPAGITCSRPNNVIIGQRWQGDNEVSTLILQANKIKYFGANQSNLLYAASYFNATIIID